LPSKFFYYFFCSCLEGYPYRVITKHFKKIDTVTWVMGQKFGPNICAGEQGYDES